jgi:uncharacterized protein with von Willebrand factor type A (vWA) domain
MFINFFFDLKQASLPVSLKEYLMLMEAMNKRVVDSFNVNDFYYLSRSALVKDERYLDKFDRVFGHSFKGLENSEGETEKEIPEEWLKLMGQKYLTDEEKKMVESLGGWDKLMETLKQRLEEQKNVTKAVVSGLALEEHLLSAHMDIILKAFGLVKKKVEIKKL